MGRTIILVTHNLALTKPIAHYVVSLGHDGNAHGHESIVSAIVTDKYMVQELERDQQLLDQNADVSTTETKPAKMEEGHVSWDALKLYVEGLSGNHYWSK